jgi:hypothetical protein
MNLQDKINAVVNKVKIVARDNELANLTINSQNDINISANMKPSGEFQLEQLRICGALSELYVTSTQITLFVDDDDVFGTVLLKYNGWDDLLNRNL